MKLFFNSLILCSLVFISCRGTTSKQPPIHLLQNMDNVGRLDPQSLNPASHIIEAEIFTDTNKNGKWDKSENFEDLNGNEIWDDEYDEFDKKSMRNMPDGTISTNLSDGYVSDTKVKEKYILNTGQNQKGDFIAEIPYSLISMDPEPLTDRNGNAKWDDKEEFKDLNGNEIWDDEYAVFINRGEERYNIYCSACHGISGNGKGIVLNEKYSWDRSSEVRPANLLDLSDKENICNDGYLFDVISNGKGAMSGYYSQISPEDRWAIVSYLRILSYSSGIDLGCGCSDYNQIKKNLKNISTLEEELISDDFKCLIELKKVQEHYNSKRMKEIQEIIKCDTYDGQWGGGTKKKWLEWKKSL